MSEPWRITRGDQQFTVKDVAELKLMGVGGKIRSGDLIQRPGTGEWLYATEVPELKGLIKIKAVDEDEIDFVKPGSGNVLRALLWLLGVAIIVVGFGVLWHIWTHAPNSADQALFGDGPNALGPLDALATEYATLLAEPDGKAKQVGEVKKDTRVKMLRKLGDFYEVEAPDGSTGWLGIAQVVPGYKFRQELSDKYDPLFNPDRYLQMANYSWVPRDDPKLPKELTDMMFQLANPTEYGMQGVILKITFYDGKDTVIDTVNYEVPRILPPQDTLHLEGIEIEIAWDEDTRAEVDILGARALLPAEYSRLKAEEEVRLLKEAEEKDAAEAGKKR
jgi:hypothetical protein